MLLALASSSTLPLSPLLLLLSGTSSSGSNALLSSEVESGATAASVVMLAAVGSNKAGSDAGLAALEDEVSESFWMFLCFILRWTRT
jgi:hypothetical protein